MIPIAICDDELLHARQTQAAIRRCEAQAVTRCFETPLALLEAAPDGVFLRCHQSYWANFSYITAMEKDEFVLTGGLRVPISRSYRSAARSTFFANLRGEEG